MRFRSGKPLKTVAVLLVLAAALGGCGRRGRLEPPPDPNAPAEASDVSKAGFHKKPVRPPILPPNTPFVLDPLLK